MARMLGGLLLIHFVIVCAIKTARGVPDEILWMSHIGLLLAGIGLVFRNATLLAATTIAIFVLHALWLGDCVAWLVTGHFPLGISTYLRDADAWVWLATAHHFYLIGLLPWCVTGRALGRPEALLLAVALYLSLTVASRAFTDPGLNVNFAFGARIGLTGTVLRLGQPPTRRALPPRSERLRGGCDVLARESRGPHVGPARWRADRTARRAIGPFSMGGGTLSAMLNSMGCSEWIAAPAGFRERSVAHTSSRDGDDDLHAPSWRERSGQSAERPNASAVQTRDRIL
jgi:hypothetical protein